MYKMIVTHEVRRGWDALNSRDYEPVLKGFARRFRYENVAADHALGGTFTTRAQMAEHFDLLFRLLPDIRFTVEDVLVRGLPHRTSLIVDVRVAASLPDGTPYENRLVQHVDLCWGKVAGVRALMDNVRARDAVERLRDAGVLSPVAHSVA
jgi:ketosteroid isomerase-like protein